MTDYDGAAQRGGDAVNVESGALEAATVRQQCKLLRMPTIGAQCTQLAEQAVRERRTHLGYLEALLQAELWTYPVSVDGVGLR
jgi:hypothetical protein